MGRRRRGEGGRGKAESGKRKARNWDGLGGEAGKADSERDGEGRVQLPVAAAACCCRLRTCPLPTRYTG